MVGFCIKSFPQVSIFKWNLINGKMKTMKGIRPKLIILVVYKTKESNWRGFCNPYDVTCEAKNKEVAMNRLEKLVKLYEEGLEKYGYPRHLSLRYLSDEDDKKVFKIVKEIIKRKIIEEMKRELKKDFLVEQQKKEEFKTKTPILLSGYFYPRPLTPTFS